VDSVVVAVAELSVLPLSPEHAANIQRSITSNADRRDRGLTSTGEECPEL
jgi:hypothetical protein